MGAEFKEQMKDLRKERRLTDFEYNQLLCLSSISDKLGIISNAFSVGSFQKCINEIKNELSTIAKKIA